MTTLLAVHYEAVDKYGIHIVDVLPVEEVPDKPDWQFKLVHPFKYRRIMTQRRQAIQLAMDTLYELCLENHYTGLIATLEWDCL